MAVYVVEGGALAATVTTSNPVRAEQIARENGATWRVTGRSANDKRAALHRGRLRLYDRQSGLILAAYRPVAARLRTGRLSAALVAQAGQPRQSRHQHALDLLAATSASRTAWDDANTNAYREAVARGRAEAQASPAHGPADPDAVAGYMAGAKDVTAALVGGGAAWTAHQTSRLAWKLSGVDLDGDDPESALDDAIDDGDGIGDSASDDMHDAYIGGFVAWWASETNLFDWVTSASACPTCDDLQTEGPYTADGVPGIPHPSCKCSVEAA